MSNIQDINKYILNQLKSKNISKEMAFDIIKLTNQDKEKQSNDIAIIGIGCKFPKAGDTKEYWDNLLNRVNGIDKFPKVRRKDLEGLVESTNQLDEDIYPIGGFLDEVDKFDAEFFKISSKEAEIMDPCQRMFLETSYMAFEDAGYGGKKIYNSKTGVYVGIDHTNKSEYSRLIAESDLLAMTGSYTGILASRVSYTFNLRGPSIVIDTACSSGLTAVHMACKAIKDGECEMAAAGGVSIFLVPRFGGMSALVSNDNCIRPFDKNAKGSVWGEGIGVILLKPLEKALEDKDYIYSVIKGSAINNNGTSNGITSLNADAQKEVIIRAWSEAKINPEEISYIEAHATGTLLGDSIEISGLNNAFKKYTNKKQFCGIGSVKANNGHLVAASGMASLIKVALSLKHKVIPPSINFKEPNPYINFQDTPLYMVDKEQRWETDKQAKIAGVNSFSFSGTNCHIVLQEAPAMERDLECDTPNIIAISAPNENILRQLLHKYSDYLDEDRGTLLRDICYTACTGRGHYKHRLAFVANSISELREKIAHIEYNSLASIDCNNIYYGQFDISVGEARSDNGITQQEKAALSKEANKYLLEHAEDTKALNAQLLEKLCKLYIKGADIDWDVLYKHQDIRRTIIPAYPLERRRCWPSAVNIINQDTEGFTDNFYEIRWKCKELSTLEDNKKEGNVLVFCDYKNRYKKLVKRLAISGRKAIEINIDKENKKIGEDHYCIKGNHEDYKWLIAEIKNTKISQIIHLSSMTNAIELSDVHALEEKKRRGIYSLFNLYKALISCNVEDIIDVLVVTENANKVSGKEKQIQAENAAIIGMCKVLTNENMRFQCRCIDIDEDTDDEYIWLEVNSNSRQYLAAYRKDIRYVEELTKQSQNESANILSIKEAGNYIIFTQEYGISLEICQYLASKSRVNISIIGAANPAEIWNSTHSEEHSSYVQTIDEITSRGTCISFYKASLDDYSELEQAINKIRNNNNHINGIIHCYTDHTYEFMMYKQDIKAASRLSSMLNNIWMIDNFTDKDKIDFCIIAYPLEGLFAFPGYGELTAISSYIDAYAANRNINNNRTLVLRLAETIKTSSNFDYRDKLDTIFKPSSIKQKKYLINQAISKHSGSLLMFDPNISELRRWSSYYKFDISNECDYDSKQDVQAKNSLASNDKDSNIKLLGRSDNLYTPMEVKLAHNWGAILGLEEVNIYDNFFRLGGNSLLVIRLQADLESEDIILSAEDFYKYPTVKELALRCGGVHDPLEEAIANGNMVTTKNHETKQIKEDKEILSTDKGKLLSNIEPFNDLFYRSCFYNACFPIAFHYNKSILPFLINDIAIYIYNDASSVDLTVDYVQCKSIEAFLETEGIIMSTKVVSENIIADIIEAIDNDKPVIVLIDCYYESIRDDAYIKEHLPHNLLIYGYNNEDRTFNVIEHSHRDNLSYAKRIVSYIDIANCYNSYITGFLQNKEYPTYYDFSIVKGITNNDMEANSHLKAFCKNMLQKQELVYKGLSGLNQFVQSIKSKINLRTIADENINVLIGNINNIVNLKQVEKYKLEKVFLNSSELKGLIDEITALWNYIRAVLGKFVYTQRYKHESFTKIADKLDIILELEYQYHDTIYQCIKGL